VYEPPVLEGVGGFSAFLAGFSLPRPPPFRHYSVMSNDPKGSIPHPAEMALGLRIRLLRVRAGVSQEELGEACGVTFQQIQKYERGVNRIGFSRLVEIAAALKMTPCEIIEPLTAGRAAGKSSDYMELLRQPAALELLETYGKLRDQKRRRQAMEFIKLLADD
jgi:transcriptional regulator with XRE-family HTH domain